MIVTVRLFFRSAVDPVTVLEIVIFDPNVIFTSQFGFVTVNELPLRLEIVARATAWLAVDVVAPGVGDAAPTPPCRPSATGAHAHPGNLVRSVRVRADSCVAHLEAGVTSKLLSNFSAAKGANLLEFPDLVSGANYAPARPDRDLHLDATP
jgi:hypothetical protein